jgi:hypothetical protein
MSDVMLYGILGMPYEIAMNDELSRFQFYKTVQRLLEKDSQQQEEIEALKADLKKYDELAIDDLEGKRIVWCACGDSITPDSGAICGACALTHPPQEPNCYGDGNVYRGVRSKDSEVQTIHIGGFKELTDEEILEVITMSHSWIDGYPKKYALDFARAILRKASEK